MIPIRDSIPTRRTPIVNYLLIAANIAVSALMWLTGSQQETLIYQFALIPASFTIGLGLGDITDIGCPTIAPRRFSTLTIWR
jgi:membrane associated rhomboid family serine protease